MNPFGALPCLKDYSFDPPFVLYESRAIARYLALQYGKGRLMPSASNLRATALFEQAASTELTSFDPAANRLVFEELFKPYAITCLQFYPRIHWC
ncbi:Glutathione S-transferase [Penicillium digitatum PHI26]|uniref:Glutathione S-transferase n=2 Tax=Penicillium digitatum TaxID=36651 RepID=K9GJ85_PEND2|nr:Glutathione S-transferase [Penicillium digitatum Pd1]EKV09401.1 Glutathione S-transferase [Penicillium digitatum Pd1]EKV14768.1 Glutathione S-transferase [Penicillium digitatum PHI26]